MSDTTNTAFIDIVHHIYHCFTEAQLDTCLEMADTQFLVYRKEQRLYDILALLIKRRKEQLPADQYSHT